MNLLAIDTSSSACVLAVDACGERHEACEIVGRSHSEVLLGRVMALLESASLTLQDLDGITFGQGPGSFTGLRIGVGVAQGLGFGLGIPLAPVSTLACLAQAAARETGAREVFAALHARKDEVYFGHYRVSDGVARLLGKECVSPVALLGLNKVGEAVAVGDGFDLESEFIELLGTMPMRAPVPSHPLPGDLMELGIDAFRRGAVVPAEAARPEYLRETVTGPAP